MFRKFLYPISFLKLHEFNIFAYTTILSLNIRYLKNFRAKNSVALFTGKKNLAPQDNVIYDKV